MSKYLRNVPDTNVVPLDIQRDTIIENTPYGAADSMQLLQNAVLYEAVLKELFGKDLKCISLCSRAAVMMGIPKDLTQEAKTAAR